MSNNIVVYHAPKYSSTLSKEDADKKDAIFFLDSRDPTFISDRQLYQFTLILSIAISNGDWYKDIFGDKHKLVLRCSIPSTSEISNTHNYINVKGEDVVVLDKMWVS